MLHRSHTSFIRNRNVKLAKASLKTVYKGSAKMSDGKHGADECKRLMSLTALIYFS